jgi:hypothetical protein
VVSGFDSSHWYRQDGKPFYTITGANGVDRSVTLRDARKINAVPSVTTVLQIVAKPQLEAWKVRQGVMAALTLPRVAGEDDDALLARIDADGRAQAKAAAEEGTRIHDAIEQSFIDWGHVPTQYMPHVEATRKKIAELFPGVNDWRAEDYFCHARGFGGKVDLHSPSTGIVIDYKGKDGDFSDKKKLAYDQHYQLAAYQTGLGLGLNVCANIFVSRTHPGLVAEYVWTREQMQEGWDVFSAALQLWKAIKKYDPSLQKAA